VITDEALQEIEREGFGEMIGQNLLDRAADIRG
jgi:hypothetical protein